MALGAGDIYNESARRAFAHSLLQVLAAGNRIELAPSQDGTGIRIENTIYDYVKELRFASASDGSALVEFVAVAGGEETPFNFRIDRKAVGDFPRAFSAAEDFGEMDFDKDVTMYKLARGADLDLTAYSGFSSSDVGRAYTITTGFTQSGQGGDYRSQVKFRNDPDSRQVTKRLNGTDAVILTLQSVDNGVGRFACHMSRDETYVFGAPKAAGRRYMQSDYEGYGNILDDAQIIILSHWGDPLAAPMTLRPCNRPASEEDIGRVLFITCNRGTSTLEDWHAGFKFYSFLDPRGQELAVKLRACQSAIAIVCGVEDGNWLCALCGQHSVADAVPNAKDLHDLLATKQDRIYSIRNNSTKIKLSFENSGNLVVEDKQ